MKVISILKELTVRVFVATNKKVTALLLFCFLVSTAVKAQTVYAITSARNLVTFSPTAPGTITSTVPLTGIIAGHSIEGLDFRPATGQLFAFSYNPTTGAGQVYRVKATTGVATPIGSTITLATGMSEIGFDFNPTVDRIRLTSATRQNYRLNPNDGSLAVIDGTLTYAAGDPNAAATPNIRAVAYTNSIAGTTSTTIYYYDYNLNILATSTNPNGGTMTTVGSSGIVAGSGSPIDLDIYTSSTGMNTAYMLANTTGSNSNLYTVNLTTGAATLVGPIGAGENVLDIAVTTTMPTASKLAYGLSGNNLVSFLTSSPATVMSSMAITGIAAGQTIAGLDFRPATGQLYALGYTSGSGSSQLYTINTSTGAATPVGSTFSLAANMMGIGFDFNPTVDRIRITSVGRQNYRVHPVDATVITDGTLTYASGDPNAAATPAINAVAYTNSFAGATTTTIYYYDMNLNTFATATLPNSGSMTTVGSSGITTNSAIETDLDIASNSSAGTNTAYMVASTNGTSSNLYTVNLSTGMASLVGGIGASLVVTDIALYIAPPPPAKMVYAVAGSNLISFSSASPNTIIATVPLTGITAGQVVEGLDFRPSNGQLYALGYRASTGETQVYTVNTTTGVATAVGAAITLATNMTGVGFDFNPTVDLIRVTSSNRRNYRLNPGSGALTAIDSDLTYATTDANAAVLPDVYAAAYTNSVSGATSTTIYYYDFSLDNLATSSAPNAGVLNTVGSSRIMTSSATNLDLDIVTNTTTMVNTAFLAATVMGTSSNFYTIDLATGEAMLVGTIGGSVPVTEIAVSNMDVALPVTLADFTVEKIGRKTLVKWTTQTEVNNDGFIVERSTNGINFNRLSNRIASKAVGGNSSTSLNYEFIDELPAKGVNFYRLLQTDKDGSTRFSRILRVQFDENVQLVLYPNPATNIINLNAYFDSRKTLTVRMIDAGGKAVAACQYKISAGAWNERINIASFSKGMYYVQVSDGDNIIFNQPVQKQ